MPRFIFERVRIPRVFHPDLIRRIFNLRKKVVALDFSWWEIREKITTTTCILYNLIKILPKSNNSQTTTTTTISANYRRLSRLCWMSDKHLPATVYILFTIYISWFRLSLSWCVWCGTLSTSSFHVLFSLVCQFSPPLSLWRMDGYWRWKFFFFFFQISLSFLRFLLSAHWILLYSAVIYLPSESRLRPNSYAVPYNISLRYSSSHKCLLLFPPFLLLLLLRENG